MDLEKRRWPYKRRIAWRSIHGRAADRTMLRERGRDTERDSRLVLREIPKAKPTRPVSLFSFSLSLFFFFFFNACEVSFFE